MEATALSIAKSVLDGVLSKAKSAIVDEVALQLGVQRDLAFIKDEFEMMQTFLMAADKEKGQSHIVRTWVKQVRDLAYDVEDCLQESSLHLAKPSPWRSPCTLKARHQIANTIKELKARVEDVSQRNLRYRLDSTSSSPATAEQSGLSNPAAFDEAQATKRKEPNVELIQLISNGNKALRVISVWGMSDLGKPSIIREVYNNPDISREFHFRAWVKLMHPFSPNEFVRSLIRQFYATSLEEPGKTTEEKIVKHIDIIKKMETTGHGDLVEGFVHHVNEKRYLIVLDDLSTIADWDLIKMYLPDNNNGSRIIVTTQQVEIASLCIEQQNQVMEIKHIAYDQPLYLFFKKDSLPIGYDSTQMKTETESSSMAATTARGSSTTPTTEIEEHKSTNEDVNRSDLHDPQLKKDSNSEVGKNLYRSKTMAAALEQAELIGRKTDKEEVIRLISEGSAKRRVISVWGMDGIGKTTLIRNVYESQELSSQFQTRAWITVLHPFNPGDFLKSLIIQLHAHSTERKEKSGFAMLTGGGIQQELTTLGIPELISRKNDLLNEKNYLIVLDDLSSIKEWDWIRSQLHEKNNRSRIIVTTRDADVAKHCSVETTNVYKLTSLTTDAALDLFCKKVFQETKIPTDLSPDMMEQAKLILKKCDGLPLAIATIGGFLATKPKSKVEWRKLHEHISVELENNPSLEKIKTLLTSSYDGLPYHLKSCFLYLSIFPEDHNIRRRRLVRRWVAEGYTRKIASTIAHEIGEHEFNELISRSMIQPSKTVTSNIGRIDFCQVHDLMHEISISKSRGENLVFVLDEVCTLNSQDKIRHLAISNSWNRDKTVLQSMIDLTHVRSLTIFGEWQSFFISGRMRLLRVLDLEDTSGLRNHDLEQIGKLQHLKYLSLRGSTQIVYLPDALGNLRHLETLDIRGTWVTTLPATIIKLQKLQYLRAGFEDSNFEDLYTDLSDGLPKLLRNRAAILTMVLLVSCIHISELNGTDMPKLCEFIPLVFGLLYRNLEPYGVKVPRGIRKMKALHTLGVVNVASGKTALKELGRLNQLRKLGVTGIHKKNSKEFCSAISAQKHLLSLSVRIKGESGLHGHLDHMTAPPKRLQSLKLYGNLIKLPNWIEKLDGLVKLRLHGTQLEQDAIQVLEKLPSLAILFLQKESFSMEELCFHQGTFKKLEVLELNELENLTSIKFEKTSMSNLELLRISSCHKLLEEGFSGVQYLTSLKEISLKRMYSEALIKILEDQVARNSQHPNLKVEGS